MDADSKGPPRMFLLYEESQTEDTVIVLLQKDSKYCKSIYVYLNVSRAGAQLVKVTRWLGLEFSRQTHFATGKRLG